MEINHTIRYEVLSTEPPEHRPRVPAIYLVATYARIASNKRVLGTRVRRVGGRSRN